MTRFPGQPSWRDPLPLRDALPGRFLRTAAHLRPAQVAARVGLRARRAATARVPGLAETLYRSRSRSLSRPAPPGLPEFVGWPLGFVPFDGRLDGLWPDPDELAKGSLTLLGATRALRTDDYVAGPTGSQPPALDWEQADAPLLWRYHLHYWDWAWCLVRLPDTGLARTGFETLYRSWRAATPMADRVAWSPYVASLRAWSLCGLFAPLVRDSQVESLVAADLAAHAAFLRRNLERDVGGNHLLKNLKALVGLAVALGDDDELRRWAGEVRREVARQVLADGGHAERAPAYHCQVLADLDDVLRLLRRAEVPDSADTTDELSEAVGRMRGWLRAVLGPDGTVPLLNDGYPVPAEAVAALLDGPVSDVGDGEAGGVGDGEPPGASRGDAVLLADSGLAVLRAGPWHLLADVGLPCPDELPAHAHADTLGFLLWHHGTPILVDTATSTYDPGPTRDRERSSAAHSTVVVDGANSTEVWGAFRAGRRARPRLATLSTQAPGPEGGRTTRLAASHDGYRHLPGRPVHCRRWKVDAERVVVVDRVTGSGFHRVDVVFQLSPDVQVRLGTRSGGSPEPRLRCPDGTRLNLRASGPGHWEIWTAELAEGWNTTVDAPAAVYVVEAAAGRLPVEVRCELSAAP